MQSGVLSWGGEFVAQASEAEYRVHRLPEYVRQAQLCLLWAALLNVLFLLSDFRFYGQRHFYFAIPARVLIVLASSAAYSALAKVESFRGLQLVCIVWACPVVAASAVLVSPHTDIALLVTFILPAVFYLTIPVSFRLALIFGLGCSAITLAAYMSPRPLSEAGYGMLLGMLFSNVVFVLVLSQSNRLRRLEWAATQAQRMANLELLESRDTLQKIVKAVPTPLIITAKDSGSLIHFNDAACEYFGSDALNSSFRIENLLDLGALAKLSQRLRSDAQVSEFETRLRLPNGSVRDVLLEATTMSVAGTEAILTVLVDITRRKEVESIMERLANTDQLSELPNRAFFFRVAATEIKRAQRYNRPLAVFMVDIDYFKRINDTHGHKVGDLALKAFAELCRSWIRSQDIVARLGGEEFGFLLPETDARSAFALADRLRLAVENMRTEKLSMRMTISMGVSEVLPGEATVEAALSRADRALYAAKRSGRNRVMLFNQGESDSAILRPSATTLR